MRLLLASAAGAVCIAVGAQVAVPMVPVATTLQTFALLVVALVGGPRVGGLAAGGYLGLVLLGLPVLSSGQAQGGSEFLTFPAAGYVVGFVPAAVVAGALGSRPRLLSWLGAGLVGHAVVFAVGVPVLARVVGWTAAIDKGLLPFLVGAVAKSALAAGVAWILRRRPRGPDPEPPHV